MEVIHILDVEENYNSVGPTRKRRYFRSSKARSIAENAVQASDGKHPWIRYGSHHGCLEKGISEILMHRKKNRLIADSSRAMSRVELLQRQ